MNLAGAHLWAPQPPSDRNRPWTPEMPAPPPPPQGGGGTNGLVVQCQRTGALQGMSLIPRRLADTLAHAQACPPTIGVRPWARSLDHRSVRIRAQIVRRLRRSSRRRSNGAFES